MASAESYRVWLLFSGAPWEIFKSWSREGRVDSTRTWLIPVLWVSGAVGAMEKGKVSDKDFALLAIKIQCKLFCTTSSGKGFA